MEPNQDANCLPLAGVIPHAAAVMDDASLPNMDMVRKLRAGVRSWAKRKAPGTSMKATLAAGGRTWISS